VLDSILQKLNVYNNDPGFKFDPYKHEYTYNGKRFISVTRLISSFHEEFDTEGLSKKQAEKTGQTQEQILKLWKDTNDRAKFIGSTTHDWIEKYFNKTYQDLPNDLEVIDRINKFNFAFGKWLHKLSPVTFEQRIFSKKWKIAGTIDSLFLYKDKIIMLDWKTNKLFTDDNQYEGRYQKLLSPFQDFYKNHFNEYSIQVSLYKLILKEIGIEIKACYLLHIGPDSEAKMYTAKDFTTILEDYLAKLLEETPSDSENISNSLTSST
jgi:ATP-dependent exoDNAse (exonuclease V) beta subunit